MLYGLLNPTQLNPDLTIEKNNGTIYLCFLNPNLVDYQSGTDVYSQNVWKIVRIKNIKNNLFTQIEVKYPNGHCNLYQYNINEIESYDYQFQK